MAAIFRRSLMFVADIPTFKSKCKSFRKALVPMLFVQNMSSQKQLTKSITDNVEWIGQIEDRKSKDKEKPLAVILSWLMAEKKHISKFSNIYLQQGCDVLLVKMTPWQLLWPTKGSQLVTESVLDFIVSKPEYQSVLFHGFSVGAYLYGELLTKIISNPSKYEAVRRRIVGQVFDSPADIDNIPTGVPAAVTRNPILRKTMEAYIRYHMKTFYNQATKHYETSHNNFYANPVLTPALFFCSKDDAVAPVDTVMKVIHAWEAKGIKVYFRCWDSSPHVSHLYRHPEEYAEELAAFLDKLDLLQTPLIINQKAKL